MAARQDVQSEVPKPEKGENRGSQERRRLLVSALPLRDALDRSPVEAAAPAGPKADLTSLSLCRL